jgi:hypothetical protein
VEGLVLHAGENKEKIPFKGKKSIAPRGAVRARRSCMMTPTQHHGTGQDLINALCDVYAFHAQYP